MTIKERVVFIYPEKILSNCRVCKKECDKQYHLSQVYFVFLGLPLFPLYKKVYWVCSCCSVFKELKPLGQIVLDDFEQDLHSKLSSKYNSASDLRNYWGTILIVSFLTIIFALIYVAI